MHKGKNENAPSVADIDRLKKQGMKPKPVKEDLDSKDDEMIEYKLDDGTLKKMKKTHAAILPKSHPARIAFDEINSN